MNPELEAMADQLLQQNPTDEVDSGTRLQQMIVAGGKVFGEDDLIDAGRKIGMDDDAVSAFIEELASWY